VLGVEDWAEIRWLHRAERMPIKVIARVTGVSRNTVRRALAAEAPPRYQRPARGSVVDAVEPQIRELLRAWPTMPATVIAERIGWQRSIRVLRDRVAELRPAYLPPDPASRTAYAAGELAQCDLWFPPVTLPVGFGQARSATRLPVLVMVSGYSRWLSARLLPSRAAEDLFAGWWQLLAQLGGVPKALVWDQEGAVGKRRRRVSVLTEAAQAFRGVLGARIVLCDPADPEAKGLVERANGTWRPRSCPGGPSARRRTSTPSWAAGSRWSTSDHGVPWAVRRPSASRPTVRACCRCRRSRRPPAGELGCGWPVTTTCAWTPTTTPWTRPPSVAASR
jgi:transposase